MDCDQFLEGYSGYLDDRLGPEEREAFEEHMDGCESCARYDRVVQRGLGVLRDLPRVESSSDFLPRLRHRIYHLEDGIPFRSAHPGGAAALVAVAAVGLLALAWLPFASRTPLEVELPAVAVEPPPPEVEEPLPSIFDRGPFVTTGEAAETLPVQFRARPFGPATSSLDREPGLAPPSTEPVRRSSARSGAAGMR